MGPVGLWSARGRPCTLLDVRAAAWGILCVLIGLPALGQEYAADAASQEEVGSQPARPYWPRLTQPLLTGSAEPFPKGRLQIRPVATFTLVRGYYDAEGIYAAIPGDQIISTYSLSVQVLYGLAERFSFGALVTGLTKWRHTATTDVRSTGFADTLLFARGKLINQSRFFPAIAINPSLKLPTGAAVGEADRLGTDVTGTGSVDVGLTLTATKSLYPFVFHGAFGYTHAFATSVKGINTSYGGLLSWGAAVEWPIWPDVFGLQLELAGRNQAAPELSGLRQAGAEIRQLVLGAGLEVLPTRNFKMLLAYQRAMAGRNASGFDSVVLALFPSFF